MCNYLLLRPVCPTCLRIRIDGPPADPLIADPTPISICDTAIDESRICHVDSPNNLACPSTLNIIGSEQCSMCEQAQAQGYLPSCSDGEFYRSGLILELDEVKRLEWPNEVRTKQIRGNRGHHLRVIWERQVKKRDLLEQGMKVPILGNIVLEPEPVMISFPTGALRKGQQKRKFQRMYGMYNASVHTWRLPESIRLADLTVQDAALQIGCWQRYGRVPGKVADVADRIFKNFRKRMDHLGDRSGICFLAACVGLAHARLESTRSLQDLARMAGLTDLGELAAVQVEVEKFYTDFMDGELACESEATSVLENAGTKLDKVQDRHVRFRSPDEGDVVVFTSAESPASSPTASTYLEAFMRSTADTDMLGKPDTTSRRKNHENHATDAISEKSYYRALSTLIVAPVPCSSTQGRTKGISDEGNTLQILKLAEISATVFVKSRTQTTTERSWYEMFCHRAEELKSYDKVSKVKFPEEKWYRQDAILQAAALLRTRKNVTRTFRTNKQITVLLPEEIEHIPQHSDEVLDGHIRCAIELLKRLQMKRSDTDTLQYIAHVMTVSREMGMLALKKLVEEDVENEVVPSEQEWAELQAYQQRGCNSDQPEPDPVSRPFCSLLGASEDSDSSENFNASDDNDTSKDSDTPVPSYTQLRDKAINFYHRWTAEWIEMAKGLQQHEPIRRILKISNLSSHKGKRSSDELADADVQSRSAAPKRVKRKAGGA